MTDKNPQQIIKDIFKNMLMLKIPSSKFVWVTES
jgi:hypothetical protein